MLHGLMRRATREMEDVIGHESNESLGANNRRGSDVRRISRDFDKEKKDNKKSDDGPKGTFVDAAAMKEKVRQKLSKPKYAVTDFYHDKGCCQAIARSPIFDKMTLFVIFFNAIWIAIDTDMNDSALLIDADWQFLFAENFFAVFFSFEWFVRLVSFRKKLDVFKDAWFIFDSFMVTMMVLETWIFNLLVLIFSSGGSGSSVGGNASVLRIARLLRLSRMARMGKLLRVMPELMIMIKGMKAAMRSVFFTLVLLVVIMYVFAIALVQLSEDTEVGERYFIKVPEAMYTLLVFGIFLDNVGVLTNTFASEWVLASLFFLFVLLGALTVMNMLVGVLCEVVSAVAATEQEEMLVNYVNEKISRVMMLLDTDGGGSISKKEFTQILDNVEAVRCLSDVGVDVFALIDLADYIFENDEVEMIGEIELDFSRFMEVVLQLRGSNQATVKDIVDLRKFMRLSMQEHYKQTTVILDKLSEGAKMSEELMFSMTGKPFANSHAKTRNGSRTDMRLPALPESTHSPFQSEKSDPSSLQAQPFLKAYDVEGEGGFIPLPRETPNGQLLCWIPIVSPDVVNNRDPELALKGTWSPLDIDDLDTELCVPAEGEPQMQHVQAPAEFWHSERITSSAHGSNGVRQRSDVSLSKTLRIPRLHIDSGDAGDDGIIFDDMELKALQQQLEAICGQIVAGLNDAIGLAGRTVARRYDESIKGGASSSGFANEKILKAQAQCHL